MRVVAYVRVSTDEQGRSGLGLEAQRRAVADAAALKGWEVVAVHEDVASGGSTRRRPGLAAALAQLRAREADGLVAAKLDRLSRSLLDFAGLLERARREGWDVVLLEQGFDLGTPTGRAMAGMLAVFAQWEREVIGERTAAAKAVRRSAGDPRQVPDAVRARIAELHRRGMSERAIAARLDADGVPPIGARWHRGTVTRLLPRGRRRA